MHNQHAVGEPDHSLRKQAGLRLVLEKTSVGDDIEES